ncbi:hypothetical protein ACHQM5_008162 [Ranunculus cassubicifolius]
MSLFGFTAEVTNLSPHATAKHVFNFFSPCGAIQYVEIVRSGQACGAYVTFRDPHALETAVLLSGATLVDQAVFVRRYGQYVDYVGPSSRKVEEETGGSVLGTAGVAAASYCAKYLAGKIVSSTYFANGALWMSDALTKAAKVAAELGSHGHGSKNPKVEINSGY